MKVPYLQPIPSKNPTVLELKDRSYMNAQLNIEEVVHPNGKAEQEEIFNSADGQGLEQEAVLIDINNSIILRTI